jgi:hypothetical protein
MLCPKCNAGTQDNDLYCRKCGSDLSVPSTSLVTVRPNLPALNGPQLPRIAAGVGALAVGFGLEMLRRGLITRLSRPSRSAVPALPAMSDLRNVLMPQDNKNLKLPKGHEIQETVVYMRRVIRRQD